ncbi:NAD(P)-dependent oxidoreductase [Pseudomonadota bacterium]|nr:NAD(P)-dependent oxidoreductase [Pseudomonadota bacterium]
MKKSKKKYLFAGLGTMGFPMAGHLSSKDDCDIYVFNRTNIASSRWIKKYKGIQIKSLSNLSIKFDGVITCLKDDSAIKSILISTQLHESIKTNGFILDHSTTSLDLVDSISNDLNLQNKNISFFDAPVSGGEAGAINGTLSIMLGGPNKKIKEIKALMESYSKNIIHIGPSGHGQLTKMVNQLCIASLIQGLSEGIVLGKKSNLNMTKVLNAISGGAAQSWQMDNRFKTMVNSKFDFGFAIDLMIKDLKIAIGHSKDLSIKLPSSKSALQNYKKLSMLGDGQLDTSSLIKLLEN